MKHADMERLVCASFLLILVLMCVYYAVATENRAKQCIMCRQVLTVFQMLGILHLLSLAFSEILAIASLLKFRPDILNVGCVLDDHIRTVLRHSLRFHFSRGHDDRAPRCIRGDLPLLDDTPSEVQGAHALTDWRDGHNLHGFFLFCFLDGLCAIPLQYSSKRRENIPRVPGRHLLELEMRLRASILDCCGRVLQPHSCQVHVSVHLGRSCSTQTTL